jgi:hypothetical protein
VVADCWRQFGGVFVNDADLVPHGLTAEAREAVEMVTMGELRASRQRVQAVVGLSCVLAVGGLVTGSPVAHGAPAPTRPAAKAPAGTTGEFSGVAAVPHSRDAWAIGSVGTPDNARFFVGHLHAGHWSRVKAPKLGGRYGYLDAVAAGSTKSVWVGGATQIKPGNNLATKPAIWRVVGNKLVAQKLPALGDLSAAVDSISASSATNAWAVGTLIQGAITAQVGFHWNGKKWSAVTVPSGYSQTIYDVSASGPDNAWALRSDYLAAQYTFVHWNGKVWTLGAAAPAGVTLTSVTTSSAKLAYATGIATTSGGREKSVIFKLKGTKWVSVPLPRAGTRATLDSVSMRGKSAWAVGDSSVPVLLRSTGGAWKAENSPGKNYLLADVSAASATRAYAVGSFDVPESGTPTRTFFEVFTGHSWKASSSKL